MNRSNALHRAGRVFLALAALGSTIVAAQNVPTVNALNAQLVLIDGGQRVAFQTAPYRWSFGGTPLREIDRNENSIRLGSPDPKSPDQFSILMDFASGTVTTSRFEIRPAPLGGGSIRVSPQVRQDGRITGAQAANAQTATAIGLQVRIRLRSPVGDIVSGQLVHFEQGLLSGQPKGWSQRFTESTSGPDTAFQPLKPEFLPVVRSDSSIMSFGGITVNLGSGECIVPNSKDTTCRLVYARTASATTLGTMTIRQAPVNRPPQEFALLQANYEVLQRTHDANNKAGFLSFPPIPPAPNSPAQLYTVTQTDPKRWVMNFADRAIEFGEAARGLDFVDLLTTEGRNIFGSTYLRFYLDGRVADITIGTPKILGNFSVTGIENRFPGQIGTVPIPPAPGVSPGFQVINQTDVPVLVTLEQVGCLYYGIVQPGQTWQRNTGAVWFTLKAGIAPNLEEPTALSCVLAPAVYTAKVAKVALKTISNATGYSASDSVLLSMPTIIATAAGYGIGVGMQAAVRSAGGSDAEVAWAGRGAQMLGAAAGGAAQGLLLGNPAAALGMAGKAAIMSGALGAGSFGLQQAWQATTTTQLELDTFAQRLVQEVSVPGAYAGYPWPWKMEDRVMPRYVVTGGPRIRKVRIDGEELTVVGPPQPLVLTRAN